MSDYAKENHEAVQIDELRTSMNEIIEELEDE